MHIQNVEYVVMSDLNYLRFLFTRARARVCVCVCVCEMSKRAASIDPVFVIQFLFMEDKSR